MKLYVKMIAPIFCYSGKDNETKKNYIEDPVQWYPEEMEQELREKYNLPTGFLGFDVQYEPWFEKPKFRKMKVPEKCGKCNSCGSLVGGGESYCHMAIVSSENPEIDISSVYVNTDSRPIWCPIVKMNKDLERMPVDKRLQVENLIVAMASMFNAGDIWEESDSKI